MASATSPVMVRKCQAVEVGWLFGAAQRTDHDLDLDVDRIRGEAFQVADDLRDALCSQAELGKPVHQDDLHARPNAVRELGVRGAVRRLDNILAGAISAA